MNAIRIAVMAAATLLVGGGYAASQVAYFRGMAPQYAKAIDTPSVAMIAALILVGSIALAWIPDRTGEGE
ncbi:MAG TPA: hypothetical protein PLH94_09275 [Fimbriimonadaceae bacterium]|nr:hypothetical protein [Fimbriimonadaceae bacterium]